MKTLQIFWVLVILMIYGGTAQEFKTIRKTHQLIENRDIYLNGGMRSQFGGKSRIYIQIDLPENTVKWMYSFTTSKGENGTKGLDLVLQVSTLLLDSSTIVSSLLPEIKVPEGEASIDVYLCDRVNIDKFMDKADLYGGEYSFTMEGTVENTKAAVVKVDDVISGTVFLGLKNPSSMNAVNISIEVVAITETKIAIPKSKEQEKAELYGSLAWSHFEKRDYSKCIVYCDKSNAEYPLGRVMANKGLAQLIESEEEEAFETYLEAISLVNKQLGAKKAFRKMLKDLEDAVTWCIQLNGASVIKDLIKLEIK